MLTTLDIHMFLVRRQIVYSALSNSSKFKRQILNVISLIKKTFDSGNKVLIFGNGGSAAQAQHFAAELVCKFEKNRQALPTIALTTDSSILTAQSNDNGFETVFSRQIEALCRPGDLVIGLTTSDTDGQHSANIRHAFLTAQKKGAKSIGLFSQKTKNLLPLVDVAIIVPATNTAIIQEVHQTVIHLLCFLIESELVGES
ncbi:MAG: SIS domain-containing protein [Candidatus Yanofskybacteria bacterium]|nr:SIS domain-containing protein [Candidatus Yanofskybacteria bacterium]